MSRTPGRTPGRAKRGEEQYLMYNADPKKVGSRSNAQMPTDVRRTEDGFEDPEAFFFSPTNTEAGNRTMASAFQTPGGTSSYSAQTPMTTGSVGVLRRNHSRLSDLDVDDEDDEGIADDLLNDEDDLQMATPSQNLGQRYFPESNPPSVILPSRSRPLADSPSVNVTFDALPSPSRSLRTPHAASRSPRISIALSNQISPSRSTRARPSSMNAQNRSPLRTPRGGEAGLDEDVTDVSFGEQSAMDMSVDVDMNLTASTSKSRVSTSPRRGKTQSPNHSTRNAARKSKIGGNVSLGPVEDEAGDDNHLENEDSQEITPDSGRRKSRMSTMSRKSNATRNGDNLEDEDRDVDREGSYSDNDNGPEFSYDADANDGSGLNGFDDTVNDVSIGMDDDDVQRGGEISALIDDMAAGGADEQDEEEEEEIDEGDDVSMEERAVADEERSGGEEEEEDDDGGERVSPVPKKRGRPPKKAAQTKERGPPRPRGSREGSMAAKPIKTRISQIGTGEASESEEEDGYHGNFKTRRSKRQHFKPLEWWRNEHFEYTRGHGLAVIKEVVTYPEEPPTPFAVRHKRSRTTTGRSTSAAPNAKKRKDSVEDGGADEDEESWDAQTESLGLVQDYPSTNEVHRRVACTKAKLEPRAVSKGAYQYQKVFGEGQFMAAGVVYIPIGSSKATKPSKDNAYVFFVIQGVVQVTVHRTSFIMAPGGQFLIPRGNEYRIENISEDREVQLFFAQARKLRADETELETSSVAGALGVGSVPPESDSNTNTNTSRNKSKSKATGRVSVTPVHNGDKGSKKRS
ncbi:hypothetical protein IAU59_000696 [Kwoniella sp. CBS 9459]